MKTGKWFKRKMESFKDDFNFRLETLILDLTEKICIKMEQKNINRTRLSDLLNVSPPAVTKILNGNSNFTLKTLLSMSDALDLELKIDFVDKNAAPVGVYDCYFGRSAFLSDNTVNSRTASLATATTEIVIQEVKPTGSKGMTFTAAVDSETVPMDTGYPWREAA